MRSYTKDQKEKVFDTLKTKTTVDLSSSLNAAAKSGLKFPESMKKRLANLQAAYLDAGDSPDMQGHLEAAISAYFSEKGLSEFSDILTKAFNEKDWDSNLVGFFVERFHIDLIPALTVEIAIQDGKIHWRILEGEVVRYDRSLAKGRVFDFEAAREADSTFHMTWEQFKEFKNAGKRHSTVKVTQERFSAALGKSPERAMFIWNALKGAGVLDERDRLSENWRSLSSVDIVLPGFLPKDYPRVAVAIYTILNDPLNQNVIPGLPEFANFRKDCSPKTWAETGRVTNQNPHGEYNCVVLWDVAIASELGKHEVSGDGLEHDHIPANACIKAAKHALSAETGKAWWTIAVPEKLHHRYSETHTLTKAKVLSTDFMSNIKAYFTVLAANPAEVGLKPENYFMAIAALRHLYRCQVKEHRAVRTGVHAALMKEIHPVGRVPSLFFAAPELRTKLDSVFVEEMQRCLAAKA